MNLKTKKQELQNANQVLNLKNLTWFLRYLKDFYQDIKTIQDKVKQEKATHEDLHFLRGLKKLCQKTDILSKMPYHQTNKIAETGYHMKEISHLCQNLIPMLKIESKKISDIEWIVSTDLGALSKIEDFIKTIQESGAKVSGINIEQSLSPHYYPAIKDQPQILYGCVSTIDRLTQTESYTPGAYGNNDLYSYENLCKNIPHEMLFNSPQDSHLSHAHGMREYLKNWDKEELMFFKPGDDRKFIAGSVKPISEIQEIVEQIIKGVIPDADATTPLLISKPYKVEKEYRLFIIGGNIITASEYMPDINPHVPDQIFDFAKEVLKKWTPAHGFVLDICTSNNNPYIMEIQNLHSAGFYSCDLHAIVHAMNEQALKDFENYCPDLPTKL